MLIAITDSDIIDIMNEFDMDNYEMAVSIIRLRHTGRSTSEKENMVISWFKDNTSNGWFSKDELEKFLKTLI